MSLTNIKLLQWNIWYKEDPKAILEEILVINADIICLQEVTIGSSLHDGIDTVQLIKDRTGFYAYHKDMGLGDDGQLANMVLSRYPIKGARHTWINEPTGTGGYDDEYRCLIEVDIALKGHTITVATTHMSYTDRFKETDRKLAETNKLVAVLKDKQKMIFTGDLNVTPESKTIAQLSKLFNHSGPDFNEPTWTTKPFEYSGFKAETLDWRLDYVFCTNDIGVVSSEVLNTERSDHLPVLVQFSLEESD